VNKQDILRKIRLKDEHEQLKKQLLAGKQSLEEDAQISERMAAIRRIVGELETKRKPGRPRVRPIGTPRPSQRVGTPNQQAEARGLRKRINAAKQEIETCRRAFANLAGRGGPKR
jgi:hypothetical protein